MSPAGVPLFYGALDPDTAVREARHANPDAQALTLAEFRLLRPLRYVDLADPPAVPDLFDPGPARYLRQPAMFLNAFTSSISEPFERDDRIHIEYVPTQVVTEWFRTRFNPGAGGPVEAVSYRSARKEGGVNLALLIDNDGARDAGEYEPEEAVLELVAARPL